MKKPPTKPGHPFPRLKVPTHRPAEHNVSVQGALSVRAESKKAAISILRELGYTDVDTAGSETRMLVDAVALEGNDTPYFPAVLKITEGISGVHIALSVVANKLTKLKMGQWVILGPRGSYLTSLTPSAGRSFQVPDCQPEHRQRVPDAQLAVRHFGQRHRQCDQNDREHRGRRRNEAAGLWVDFSAVYPTRLEPDRRQL
jgi:hypothetical protein